MKIDKNLSFDAYVEVLKQQALNRVNEHIKMLYISAKSIKKSHTDIKTLDALDEKLIENYLHKRGYISNMISGTTIYTKGFTCVEIEDTYIKVWHDKTNNRKTIIDSSLLTGLPITLNYFERI